MTDVKSELLAGEAGDRATLHLEEPIAQVLEPLKRLSMDDSVLEVMAADESLLDTTVGHSSEGESSMKESGAESDDGSYETVESTEEGVRAPLAVPREHHVPEEVPPCPMCLMLPSDHPFFFEVHNRVMLFMAKLLGGARVCLLVPRALEEHPEGQVVVPEEAAGPPFRRELFNVYYARQDDAEFETEQRDSVLDED